MEAASVAEEAKWWRDPPLLASPSSSSSVAVGGLSKERLLRRSSFFLAWFASSEVDEAEENEGSDPDAEGIDKAPVAADGNTIVTSELRPCTGRSPNERRLMRRFEGSATVGIGGGKRKGV